MNKTWWDKAVAFHGHECPGLAIGLRACEAAIEKMGVNPAEDEELVCICETDACGVDAVQALLSCTIGKGNLIYKNLGKQAYTFINRKNGQGMRFYLKARNQSMERAAFQQYLLDAPIDELFSSRELTLEIPEKARLFKSVTCEKCGELLSEQQARLEGGKTVCLSCFSGYTRGWG
jgi:formylmethanofuran dehydrogenase subunit E